MKILNLRLKGFIGIKKGLGLDEVGLDLSGLSGLIAIAGPNGHGKTTLLDNLQPYRTLPSRKRSLQHHVFLRDSFRDIEFEFDGYEYRSLIKIDADSERSEAYLYRNGHSLVDGKVTNYDRKIINLFGSPELFFNSVFCHQNSKKLSEMTTGDLKKLFSEFLRLDRLIEHENTSKQCAGILLSRSEKILLEIDRLSEAAWGKDQALQELAITEDQLKIAENSLLAVKANLEKREEELKVIEAVVQKNEFAEDRLKDLEVDWDRLKKESEDFEKRTKRENDDLLSKTRDVELGIMENQSLLANEKEIREAAEKVKNISAGIEAAKKHLDEARISMEEADKKAQLLGKEYSKAESRSIEESREFRHEVFNLEQQLIGCKNKLIDLEKRDPECKSTICSFIVGALLAQKEIPEIEKSINEKRAQEEKNEKKHIAILNDIEAKQHKANQLHNDKALHFLDATKNLQLLEGKLREIQKLANDLPNIEIAAQRKADLEKRLTELQEENGRLKKSNAKQRQDLDDQRASLAEKIEEVKKEIDSEAVSKCFHIKNKIQALKLDLSNLDGGLIPSLQADIKNYRRTIEEKEEAEKELAAANEKLEFYKNEESEWIYLKDGCSKDGLRALEIDSVAPVITGYANDLLMGTFGPGNLIRFRTQDEETLREVLDILVIRENGDEDLLDDLSGGEKVWSLKALRLAMTLLAKEKSGKNFLSALADEEDGALDTDNAQNFVSLYRSFMKFGGFQDCFYISHKPETIGMADHVIKFNGNGISIG